MNSSFGPSTSDQKRRSSSRSIKRKKFDDELVECSLPNKIAKPRTHSISSPAYDYTVTAPSTSTSNVTFEAPALPPDHGKGKKAPPKPLAPSLPSASYSTFSNNKRAPSRKLKPLTQGHKDLGRWKPADDLALINGILQTNDIKTVHRGLKFSCKFTVHECTQRWFTLLYDPNLSRLAVQGMQNLHPEVVHSVQTKALFSKDEEDLLGTITSTTNPGLDVFLDLLKKNPFVFHRGRTAKSLFAHWTALKSHHLLPDQTVPVSTRMEKTLRNFTEFEDSIAQSDLQDNKDPVSEFEVAQEHRLEKKEIKKLEEELKNLAVVVDYVTGTNMSFELDKTTYAVLQGKTVRYLMKFRDVTLGRCTNEHSVDLDLSLEGPAFKISRRQATIRLRNSGDFFIANLGKRPIYVDGRPIVATSKYKLNHNSIIEIGGLLFTFLINQSLVQALRSETKAAITTTVSKASVSKGSTLTIPGLTTIPKAANSTPGSKANATTPGSKASSTTPGLTTIPKAANSTPGSKANVTTPGSKASSTTPGSKASSTTPGLTTIPKGAMTTAGLTKTLMVSTSGT